MRALAHLYAYRFAGMLQESVAECEKARQNDPSVKIKSSALNAYLYLGEYDKFLQSLPAKDSSYVIFYRGLAEYFLGHRESAAEKFDRAYRLDSSLMPARVGKALSESRSKTFGLGVLGLGWSDGVHALGVEDESFCFGLCSLRLDLFAIPEEAHAGGVADPDYQFACGMEGRRCGGDQSFLGDQLSVGGDGDPGVFGGTHD